MTKNLDYPLRFAPIYVEKVWGGNRLNKVLHKDSPYENTGESWEISAVKENISIIENGPLEGQDLRSICEKYPNELMGRRITEKFDGEFPLLIKFLDAHIPLSVQVHPDDALAKAYDSFGKNEMWYIIDANDDAKIYLGFENDENRASIKKAIENNNIIDKIKHYTPKQNDVFFVPAREVHALGAGVLLAEIQQTSDVTFRLYDWDRKYDDERRELHIEESLNTLNFKASKGLHYPVVEQSGAGLIHNDYFKTNRLVITEKLEKDTRNKNSFVIYMVIEGGVHIKANGHIEKLQKGQTALVPFGVETFSIEGYNAEILEIYI